MMTRNNLLLCLLLCLPLAGTAQIKKRIETYSDGRIWSIQYWNELTGTKEGHWTYYDQDGKLQLEENYKNGELDGKKIYYSHGKIEEIAEYKQGLKDGIYAKYNNQPAPDAKHVLVFTVTYRNNREHGMGYVYDEDGKLRERCHGCRHLCNGQRTRLYQLERKCRRLLHAHETLLPIQDQGNCQDSCPQIITCGDGKTEKKRCCQQFFQEQA